MRDRSRADAAADGGDVALSEVPAPNGTTGTAVLVAQGEEAGGFVAASMNATASGGAVGFMSSPWAVLLAQRVVDGNALAEEVAGLRR